MQTLFENEIKNNLEPLFTLLIHLKPRKGFNFLRHVLSACVAAVFNSPSASVTLLEQFHAVNRAAFFQLMAELSESENRYAFFSKLIDFSQTTKNFPNFFIALTVSENHYFSISLALLAVKREYLKLESWLEKSLKESPREFAESFMRYLNVHIFTPLKRAGDGDTRDEILEKSQLTINSIAIIFENFLLNANTYRQAKESDLQKIRAVYEKLSRIFPDLSQASIKQPDVKVNEIFEKLYFGQLSSDEFVDILIKLKASSKNKDNEVFSCIMINIMKEYKFFKNYPEKQLRITAEVYGKMIQKKVVDGRSLAIFLKGLTDCLEMDGLMFEFGLAAVQKFALDVDAIPLSFYKHLFAIKRLRDKHFDFLYEVVCKLNQAGKLAQIPAEHRREVSANKEHSLPAKKEAEPTGFNEKRLSETLMEVLAKEFQQRTSQEKQLEQHMDELTFHLNSVDPNRLEAKVLEFDKLIQQKKLLNLFSKCLVYKRVPSESGLLQSYSKIVFKSGVKGLYRFVYRDTMVMLNTVLDFINAKETLLAEEKTYLRNCGRWGGFITFALNQPIQLRHLNIKQKVLEAVEKKKQSNIVIFLCSLLASVDASEFFKTKTPMVNALLDLLREVHQLPFLSKTT